MNKTQKWILLVVIVVIVAMLLYPPFHKVVGGGRVTNDGYHFILYDEGPVLIKASVNEAMLLTQWIGVLIVGGIAFFLAKGGK